MRSQPSPPRSRTLGQMPVAHQPPAAIIGELVGMAAEQARNLALDRLRQKRSRAIAQNLGQRISKSSWLRELENISLGHGGSLLCWRSGGLEHPHDTPPHPFTPSPTFVHSSGGTLSNGYTFGVQQGLSLSGTGIFNVYSIDIHFYFSDVNASFNGFERILDFKNRTSDSGLYSLNGSLVACT